ncbi:MAG TPA: hypothetical protein VKE22_27915, partial [Haliangiales bacterium]|nr:hypothetical protein [Haliangiales bacterium]
MDDVPDNRGWLQKAADEILDRVDTAGLSRALFTEAMGLARHPLAALGAWSRFAAGTLVAAGATAARFAGARPPPA